MKSIKRAAQANQGARVGLEWTDSKGHIVNVDKLQADNARLRKELEEANKDRSGRIESAAKDIAQHVQHVCCDHEATISKLKAFSEDQARQIQRLERSVGEAMAQQYSDAQLIGVQRRELEKLRRGRGR